MRKIVTFLMISQLFISCSSENNEVTNNTNTGEYFAVGSKYARNKDNNFTQLAAMWVDGVPTILSNTTAASVANAIAFYNNDTYVVGTESLENGNSFLKLWKNDTSESLTDGTHHVDATDIAVNNGDVYIVGNDWIGASNSSIATVWKNGQAIHLSDELSGANAIHVYNNEIYVAGYKDIYDKRTAMVWKMGSETILYLENNYMESFATDIFVDNTGVYVAGYISNGTASSAIFWKNNVAAILSDEDSFSEASSLFIYNSDVYVTGYDISVENYNFNGKIWKNGSLVKEMDDASPNCMYIKDNVIYIGGFGLNDSKVNQDSKIWKSDLSNLNFDVQYKFENDVIKAIMVK